MKNFKLLLALLLVCLLCLSFTIKPIFGIRYTVTPSLPYKLFISRPISSIKKSQYVTLAHPKSKILVAKQIVGLPGDEVIVRDHNLYLNDKQLGFILDHSKSGKKFNPIQEGKIPEGFVFLYAPHVDSFDSRYQEFGLVPVERLEEVLWPLF
jgi:conjugal transfer pilin signal peptidase TrbI